VDTKMPTQNAEDDRFHLPEGPTSFPKVITIAGALWLIVGVLVAVDAAVLLLLLKEARLVRAAMGPFCIFLTVGPLALLGLVGLTLVLVGGSDRLRHA
jgi:hypothetical protein